MLRYLGWSDDGALLAQASTQSSRPLVHTWPGFGTGDDAGTVAADIVGAILTYASRSLIRDIVAGDRSRSLQGFPALAIVLQPRASGLATDRRLTLRPKLRRGSCFRPLPQTRAPHLPHEANLGAFDFDCPDIGREEGPVIGVHNKNPVLLSGKKHIRWAFLCDQTDATSRQIFVAPRTPSLRSGLTPRTVDSRPDGKRRAEIAPWDGGESG